MEIRPGIASDLLHVIKLFKLLDKKHISNGTDFRNEIELNRYTNILQQCLRNINYILHVAEIQNNIVGFGIGRIVNVKDHSFLKDHKFGEIQYLFVEEKHKRKGIGTQILKSLEQNLIAMGINRLELRVYDFNKKAYPESANYNKRFSIYEKIINHNEK